MLLASNNIYTDHLVQSTGSVFCDTCTAVTIIKPVTERKQKSNANPLEMHVPKVYQETQIHISCILSRATYSYMLYPLVPIFSSLPVLIVLEASF